MRSNARAEHLCDKLGVHIFFHFEQLSLLPGQQKVILVPVRFARHVKPFRSRLHGNPDERSIGQAVSSGCVRLLNQDVIDLYERVPSGTPIVVWQA